MTCKTNIEGHGSVGFDSVTTHTLLVVRQREGGRLKPAMVVHAGMDGRKVVLFFEDGDCPTYSSIESADARYEVVRNARRSEFVTITGDA